MRVASICFVLIALVWALACMEGASEPAPDTDVASPTQDVQATIEAGIASTRGAGQSIEATITGRAEATKAAEPTPSPMPTPTPTPSPMPTPTPVPSPTVTPIPTPVPTVTPSPTPPPEDVIAGLPTMMLDLAFDYAADFRTGHGNFKIKLLPEQAPATVNSFVFLARQGFYDGLIFHRVIEQFMIQGGDPTGTGQGGPGYQFRNEIVPGLEFDRPGRLAMANAGPDTNGSQFFITTVSTPHLDGSYTIFGQVIEGQDVVDSISRAPTDSRDRPLQPVTIENINIIATPSTQPPTASPAEGPSLAQYAASHAGGPGAIYVGDLAQLAGPAVTASYMQEHRTALGDADGNVPLYAIEQHQWIYESDYYRSLLDKARLTNPTELASTGEDITIQLTCVSRETSTCRLMESYFVPNVAERTNGQVTIEVTSFPDMGLAGVDSAQLMRDGTLEIAEVYGGYVGLEYPILNMQYLWGLWPDHRAQFEVLNDIAPDMNRTVTDGMDAQVLMWSWIGGSDQFIFSKKPLLTPGDFKDLKIRVHSPALGDWIYGMGAEDEFLALWSVHDYLESGVLDAAVTTANAAFRERWYEVTGYMNGPLYSFNANINAINGDVWAGIPPDLQRILMEEGAKHELESLRLASIQNLTGLLQNLDTGLEFIEFEPEVRAQSLLTVQEIVIPEWLERIGFPGRSQETVAVFNDRVGPRVGLRIDPDGTVASTNPTAMADPEPAPEPRPTPTPPPVEVADDRKTWAHYAAENAGGPGAIYVGDLAQLAGPAVTASYMQEHGTVLGDDDGNVPLYAIERNRWIFETDYYESLLEKARLANPAELVSTGQNITLQHTCADTAHPWCRHLMSYFAPNVARRTNGQVTMEFASHAESDIARGDVPLLLKDGALSMTELYGGYSNDRYGPLDLQYLWGLWPDDRTHFEVQAGIAPDVDQLIANDLGATVLMRNWIAGEDRYIFSNERLDTYRDFRHLHTFAPAVDMADWLWGMDAGATGPDDTGMEYRDLYVALQRQIFDGFADGATTAMSGLWPDVASYTYMNGPLVNFNSSINVVNGETWESIPPDLQQILLEEGAKHELESLRLAAIQDIVPLQRNLDTGLELVGFSPEIRQRSYRAGHERVLRAWFERIGFPGKGQKLVDVFNRGMGPLVGIRIEPNGHVGLTPITAGPHVGKTMEQVLAE